MTTETIKILVVGDDEEGCTYVANMLSAKHWQTDIAWIGSKAAGARSKERLRCHRVRLPKAGT